MPASRSPLPPQRPAMISAAMLIAVSSGVRAPRSRPIGLESLDEWAINRLPGYGRPRSPQARAQVGVTQMGDDQAISPSSR